MTHLRSLFQDHGSLSEAEHTAMASLRRGGISSVIWVITERCNLKCVHCYEGDRYTNGPTTEEAMKIIDRLYEAGKPLTFISGGEPLLRDDIFTILGRLKELGFRVLLSTNGTLIDEEVAHKLAHIGVDNVAISLYGPKEVHDSFTRVKGSHAKVIRAFELLSGLGVALTVKTVMARRVLPHIDYLFSLADRFGVKALYLCDFLPIGRGALLRDQIPGKDDWRALLNLFIEKIIIGDGHPGVEIDIGLHPSAAIYVMEELRKRGYDVSSAEDKMRKRRLSTEGRGFISISPRGEVLLSNYLPLIIGRASEDLREVLKHPLYAAAGDSSKLKGWCGSCPYREMCGGSRVKAYIYSGDLLGEDPTCLIND